MQNDSLEDRMGEKSSLLFFHLVRYAFFGFPLGFIGIPLYVHLPKYYSDTLSLSLTSIGLLLFLTRLIDCFLDPFIGYWSDLLIRKRKILILWASIVLGGSVYLLFYFPFSYAKTYPFSTLALLLATTYLSYSVLMINYYASGLQLSKTYQQSLQVSAWREGAILFGVILSSALPQFLLTVFSESQAYQLFSVIFIAILGVANFIYLPTLKFSIKFSQKSLPWKSIYQNKSLKWIYPLFFLNAIPPAITATLFLFFVSDVLMLQSKSGLFLVIYFMAAILSMPLWGYVCEKGGKRHALMGAMLLGIFSFVWAYMLQANDSIEFIIICILTGFSLGGDMSIIPSLLADALGKENQQGGVAFGIWSFISKFTLALAAGISLPLISFMGYSQNTLNNPEALNALSFGYTILPCLFKSFALILLFLSPIDQKRRLS